MENVRNCKNVRNRVDIKLMRTADEKRIKTYIAKPTYVRSAIFNEDLIGIENHKTEVKLNKPIYVGMSILDLSKHLMYDFYYNQLKKQYGDRVRLLYTDTDSVIIHVRTDDLYEDMKKNMDLYDTSNFPEDHPSYCTTNKKVVGTSLSPLDTKRYILQDGKTTLAFGHRDIPETS